MPLHTKKGYRIRASDKSLVLRFSTNSLLLLFLGSNCITEPKYNHNNRLEIGSFSTRWQGQFVSHAIHDSNCHNVSSGMCYCYPFISAIPI